MLENQLDFMGSLDQVVVENSRLQLRFLASYPVYPVPGHPKGIEPVLSLTCTGCDTLEKVEGDLKALEGAEIEVIQIKDENGRKALFVEFCLFLFSRDDQTARERALPNPYVIHADAISVKRSDLTTGDLRRFLDVSHNARHRLTEECADLRARLAQTRDLVVEEQRVLKMKQDFFESHPGPKAKIVEAQLDLLERVLKALS